MVTVDTTYVQLPTPLEVILLTSCHDHRDTPELPLVLLQLRLVNHLCPALLLMLPGLLRPERLLLLAPQRIRMILQHSMKLTELTGMSASFPYSPAHADPNLLAGLRMVTMSMTLPSSNGKLHRRLVEMLLQLLNSLLRPHSVVSDWLSRTEYVNTDLAPVVIHRKHILSFCGRLGASD